MGLDDVTLIEKGLLVHLNIFLLSIYVSKEGEYLNVKSVSFRHKQTGYLDMEVGHEEGSLYLPWRRNY